MLQPQILSFTNRLSKCALTHHRRKPVVLCYLTTTEKRLPCVKGAVSAAD